MVGRELLSEKAIRDYVDDPEFRSAVEEMVRVPVIPDALRRRLREGLIGLLVGRAVALRSRVDVGKLVETQVNKYDVSEIEDMVLKVTRQHLRWISWFGAVLGALIGCLQLALNLLS